MSLDAAKITVEKTRTPRDVPAEDVRTGFGSTVCSDHMVTAVWKANGGWEAPKLEPYGPFSLMPTASVLHYATECFEGLKVYRGFDGKLRLFRPDCNAERMMMSSERISLPTFDPKEFVELVRKLVAVDGAKWLPRDRPGDFMYLRPTMIGTQSQLGPVAPAEALFYTILAYLPRLDSPPGGMHLMTNPSETIRAWAGGFGYAKVGANYGPSLQAGREARDKGYHQILWIYGDEGYCTEAGASNFFVVWQKAETGRRELVTAPLDDRLILAGVTRRSVLELARERLGADLQIVERRYTVDELILAHQRGLILEAFAAGTAYFVCPVSRIHHRGVTLDFGMGPHGNGGSYTVQLKKWLYDIMYGNVEHEWGVVVEEET